LDFVVCKPKKRWRFQLLLVIGSHSLRGSQGKPQQKPSRRCSRCSAVSILICEDHTFDNDTAFAQHGLLRTMRDMTTWFCLRLGPCARPLFFVSQDRSIGWTLRPFGFVRLPTTCPVLLGD
jgi:hypothetical protein